MRYAPITSTDTQRDDELQWEQAETERQAEPAWYAGYRWSTSKGMWYFPGVKSGGQGNVGMDAIRRRYGSQRVASRPLHGIDSDE